MDHFLSGVLVYFPSGATSVDQRDGSIGRHQVLAKDRKSAGGGRRERARFSRYAKATFKKDRRLNIRLSSKDLEAIQKRALAEGLPYQTLIASLLHKYAAGLLKEV